MISTTDIGKLHIDADDFFRYMRDRLNMNNHLDFPHPGANVKPSTLSSNDAFEDYFIPDLKESPHVKFNLPAIGGHDLMAIFPAACPLVPLAPIDISPPHNFTSISISSGNLKLPIPTRRSSTSTSEWFKLQEMAYFGKDIREKCEAGAFINDGSGQNLDDKGCGQGAEEGLPHSSESATSLDEMDNDSLSSNFSNGECGDLSDSCGPGSTTSERLPSPEHISGLYSSSSRVIKESNIFNTGDCSSSESDDFWSAKSTAELSILTLD